MAIQNLPTELLLNIIPALPGGQDLYNWRLVNRRFESIFLSYKNNLVREYRLNLDAGPPAHIPTLRAWLRARCRNDAFEKDAARKIFIVFEKIKIGSGHVAAKTLVDYIGTQITYDYLALFLDHFPQHNEKDSVPEDDFSWASYVSREWLLGQDYNLADVARNALKLHNLLQTEAYTHDISLGARQIFLCGFYQDIGGQSFQAYVRRLLWHPCFSDEEVVEFEHYKIPWNLEWAYQLYQWYPKDSTEALGLAEDALEALRNRKYFPTHPLPFMGNGTS